MFDLTAYQEESLDLYCGMNKMCPGDPFPGVSGQEQAKTMAAVSVLTQSPVATPGYTWD